MSELTLAPIAARPDSIAQYRDLLHQGFPENKAAFTDDYLSWLYLRNPDGQVFGFDAWNGSRLVAHYATVPIMATIRSETGPALLSLNTATHPEFQGRGLFTKLASATYDAAAQQGFRAVVGVANANSTPGFVRKLDFQLVEPLRAMVGVGPLRIDQRLAVSEASDFVRNWRAETARWRASCPDRPIFGAGSSQQRLSLAARSNLPGVTAWAERPVEQGWPVTRALALRHLGPRIYLGLAPDAALRRNLYVNIPTQLRPVPLNFIYRPLVPSAPKTIERGRVLFDFLDFDAF
ncbi:MAG TPA: GNAT family N-acetyltransferase [Microvirga sp.]|jgi:GNAT superfamily N-acetyltransferase